MAEKKKIILYKDYEEQYCKKHDQKYAGFLKECPICVGERMNGYMLKDKKKDKK